MQVLPDIYQFNGSPFGRQQNSFVVNHAGGTVMFDSGDMTDYQIAMAEFGAKPSLPHVERNAARWGFRMEDLTHLFITHAHFDHASHAAELQRRGVKIVASAPTAEAMRTGDGGCIGYAHLGDFETCEVDIVLEDGDTVQSGDLTVTAIATPGHCPGLMIYEVEIGGERSWFVGDLLATTFAHKTVDLPWMGEEQSDLALHTRTMKRLVTMVPNHVFPGHGPAGIDVGRGIIEMSYTSALTAWRKGDGQR